MLVTVEIATGVTTRMGFGLSRAAIGRQLNHLNRLYRVRPSTRALRRAQSAV